MGKGRSAGEHGQTVAWGGCSCGFLKICFSIIFSPSISRASELINWRGRGCCCAFQEKGDLREGSMPGQMEEWVAFSHGRLGAPWLISGFRSPASSPEFFFPSGYAVHSPRDTTDSKSLWDYLIFRQSAS